MVRRQRDGTTTPSFWLGIVSQNGLALKGAPASIKRNISVAIAAIKNNPHAIHYVHHDLYRHARIVLCMLFTYDRFLLMPEFEEFVTDFKTDNMHFSMSAAGDRALCVTILYGANATIAKLYVIWSSSLRTIEAFYLAAFFSLSAPGTVVPALKAELGLAPRSRDGSPRSVPGYTMELLHRTCCFFLDTFNIMCAPLYLQDDWQGYDKDEKKSVTSSDFASDNDFAVRYASDKQWIPYLRDLQVSGFYGAWGFKKCERPSFSSESTYPWKRVYITRFRNLSSHMS